MIPLLYEIFRVGKSIKTGHSLEVARGLGEGRVGSTGLWGAGLCGEWRQTRFRASLGSLLSEIRAE